VTIMTYHVLQEDTRDGQIDGHRHLGTYQSRRAARAAIREDVLGDYDPDEIPANGRDTEYADVYIIVAEVARVRAVPVVTVRCELRRAK